MLDLVDDALQILAALLGALGLLLATTLNLRAPG